MPLSACLLARTPVDCASVAHFVESDISVPGTGYSGIIVPSLVSIRIKFTFTVVFHFILNLMGFFHCVGYLAAGFAPSFTTPAWFRRATATSDRLF